MTAADLLQLVCVLVKESCLDLIRVSTSVPMFLVSVAVAAEVDYLDHYVYLLPINKPESKACVSFYSWIEQLNLSTYLRT